MAVRTGICLVPTAAAAFLGAASLYAVTLAGYAVLLLALRFAEAVTETVREPKPTAVSG